jgi:hypothetical protein
MPVGIDPMTIAEDLEPEGKRSWSGRAYCEGMIGFSRCTTAMRSPGPRHS